MTPERQALDRHSSGFTVLEVIVAFVIIALTLAAVMEIFSGGFRNTVTSKAYLRALAHAESELARVGADVPLVPGTRDGRTEDGLVWRRVIRPYAGASDKTAQDRTAPVQAFTVEVTVFTDDGRDGAARQVMLRTLRLGQAP